MYDKCYFCLDQLPKLKKESIASFFINFGRSRGTKEPTYITVILPPSKKPAATCKIESHKVCSTFQKFNRLYLIAWQVHPLLHYRETLKLKQAEEGGGEGYLQVNFITFLVHQDQIKTSCHNVILFRQLSKTHDVLKKTKENLENQCESKRE